MRTTVLKSLEEALDRQKDTEESDCACPICVTKGELNKLVQFIGDFYWNTEQRITSADIPLEKHSALYPAAEALSILRSDSIELNNAIKDKKHELEISRHNFTTFFNAIEQYLLVVRASDLHILYANHPLMATLRLSDGELNNCHFLSLFEHRLHDNIRDAFKRADSLKQFTFRVPLHAQEISLPTETTIIPSKWNDEIAYFVVSKDITEQLAYEEQLKAALDESHKLNRELTEHNRLVEEQTERANRLAQEAERANIAKSEFLANMSHESRTPMNGVIGMTSLLMRSQLSEQQRDYAETIQRSGEALITLINDILDISKIEAQKLSIEKIDFSFPSFIEEIVNLLKMRIYEKGLELHLAIAPGIPKTLHGDPTRVRQILINLLGNAIKFTDEGSISIAVYPGESNEICFTLTDTGIGIHEEDQQHLFASFTQADATTTRRYGGTGLGLAITKRLTELMNGRIALSSAIGKGTSFTISLPLRSDTTILSALPKKGKTVLIVSANSLQSASFGAHLQWNGYDSITTASASEAIDHLYKATTQPIAIIADEQLPRMSGSKLIVTLQQDAAFAGLHYILLNPLLQEPPAVPNTLVLELPLLPQALLKNLRHKCSPPQVAVVEESEGSTPLSNQPLRILLVEDNPTNQIVAKGMLEAISKEISLATNGIEALEMLRTEPIDLIFMDCQMPLMDGYEATRKIRTGDAGVPASTTPVIAMTAHAMAGDKAQCIAAGMDDYISKPVDINKLLQLVEKWQNRRSEAEIEEELPSF